MIKEPWITHELLEGIQDTHNLRKIAVHTGNQADWARTRLAKNEINKNLKNAKADFIKDNLSKHNNDPNKYWELIKQLLNPQNSNSLIALTNQDTGSPVDSNSVSEHLNKFVADIGPSLAKDFNQDWIPSTRPLSTQIKDIQTDEQEVLLLSRKIETHTSSAIESLSSRVLKDAFICLPTVMSNLFNLSLRTCKFPSKWKQAKNIPLHKGGSKDDVNNYRLISLLPLSEKLLEKIIHLRLKKYLEDNVVLSPNQHGFRPGHSTVDTVADFTDDSLML